ncbi:Phospholipase A2 domain [Trinorchestia longiramus]|nr:Phospholipase A2 domain [Trinorchestia longiramus]
MEKRCEVYTRQDGGRLLGKFQKRRRKSRLRCRYSTTQSEDRGEMRLCWHTVRHLHVSLHLLLAVLVVQQLSYCTALAAPSTHNSTQSVDEEARRWGEEAPEGGRSRRSVKDLFNMLTCSTPCDPLAYKGYGCYCGFMGSGAVVDGIDRCCQIHDWCYERAGRCSGLQWYTASYAWHCFHGRPFCAPAPRWRHRTCGQQLCECDRAFAECLRHQPCPGAKAMCVSSPWRLAQNVFMGVVGKTGFEYSDNFLY